MVGSGDAQGASGGPGGPPQFKPDTMTEPSSSPSPRMSGAAYEDQTKETRPASWWQRLTRRLRPGNGSLRETLEEIIEESDESKTPIGADERSLLVNILKLRGQTVSDVMVPRADIVAVEVGSSRADLIDNIARQGHSRLPVYRKTLDDVIGVIHVKDLITWQGEDKDFKLIKLLRQVLFVAPSMEVLELLLEMRATRTHMALVVDEYGGVDGLVTIEDAVEEIVGEIEDEHDRTEEPVITDNGDGSYTADARVTLESLEEKLGSFLTQEERDTIDTLGGLVFSVAGRVPIRNELVTHPSGLEFQILAADPRRIQTVRLRRPAPTPPAEDEADG